MTRTFLKHFIASKVPVFVTTPYMSAKINVLF